MIYQIIILALFILGVVISIKNAVDGEEAKAPRPGEYAVSLLIIHLLVFWVYIKAGAFSLIF